MAYELINEGPVTPHRLQAMVRLLARKEIWDRQEILDLVQPIALDSKQAIGKAVFRAASNLDLTVSDGDKVSLTPVAKELVTIEAFRRWLVVKTSSARTDSIPNYRFNLFTAWYAMQDEEVIRTSNESLVIRFNERMPSDSEDRQMNPTKLNAWRTLAAFLGYGWAHGKNLVPDATVRLRPLVTELLPDSKPVPIGIFVSRLGEICPELDDGDLFRLSWQHDRQTRRERRVSLMVSSALRRFNVEGIVSLDRSPDAQEIWRLFPASGFTLEEVSHITRGEVN